MAAAVVAGAPAATASVRAESAGPTCTAAQKQRRQQALAAFRSRMAADRRAYFRRNPRAKARAAFVKRQRARLAALRKAAACRVVAPPTSPPVDSRFREWDVPRGSHPHDVAPAPDGTVWYTAQFVGALGTLDPASGRVRHIPLGAGSAPHGVIVGPDGAPWITDQGLNAIVRVDPRTEEVRVFRVPTPGNAGLNTAAFDGRGTLWFTGNSGWYGRLDPASGRVQVWPSPRGAGPYGIAVAPDGFVYYASLQGSYVGRVDPASGAVTVLEPPTRGQGARRVWADSRSRVWVAEWNAGQLGMYDPATGTWREWRLPGQIPAAYAVYVDDRDVVWLTDFGSNSIVRFDPQTEAFQGFRLPTSEGLVRQLLGRPGELWGAESRVDKIVLLRTG